MKKVELLGLDLEVEFDENKIFDFVNSDNETVDAVVTTDGRLIMWDDGANSWVHVARWAEDVI